MSAMMRCLIIALVAAGCSDSSSRNPPAAASGSDTVASPAATVPDICQIAITALDGTTCAAAEVKTGIALARTGIRGIIDKVSQRADAKQIAATCGQLLLALERDVKRAGCALAIGSADRARIDGVMTEFYAQRTAVVATNHPASDAFIAKLAAVRDATCACRDGDASCLDGLTPRLRECGELPADAPQPARTLAGKLLEDASRCAARVRAKGP